MTVRRLLPLLTVAAWIGTGSAWAQTETPTVTPTETPTVTPTATPWIGVLESGTLPHQPHTATLFGGETQIGASGGSYVGAFAHKGATVRVATCTSYTLLFEGSNDGMNWATLVTKANTDIGENTIGHVELSSYTVAFLRARITAISSCDLTVKLHMTQ